MDTDERHRARLRRGRRVWDLLSAGGDSVERMQAPAGPLMIENLRLRGGEAVLDIGCGRGAHFGAIRDAIGPHGRLVGVDNSPKMVRQARRRATGRGWDNVEVVHADACRARLGREDFDAAVATFALSAMPDVHAAVTNIHAALRPGGRLFVLDLRLVPDGRRRLLIRCLGALYRLVSGCSGEDVLAGLDAVFETVEGITKDGRTRDRSRSWPPVTIVVATKQADGRQTGRDATRQAERPGASSR